MKKMNLSGVLVGFALAFLLFLFVSAKQKNQEQFTNSNRYKGGSYSGVAWIVDKKTGKMKVFEVLTKKVYIIDYESETITKEKIAND